MSTSSSKEEYFQAGREGEQWYMRYSLQNNRTMIEVGALREQLGSGAPMIYVPQVAHQDSKFPSPDFLSVNVQAIVQGNLCPWMDASFVWTAQNMWSYPFLWNEVKTKKGCTWSLICKCYQTGIDARHLKHYRMVQEKTGIPVILFFLQTDHVTVQKGIPANAGPCPKGIYACPVSWDPDMTFPSRDRKPLTLEQVVKLNYWKGMVYWNVDKLIYLGPAEELAPSNSKAVRHINPCPSISDGMRKASSPTYKSGNYTSHQIIEPIVLTPVDTTAIEKMYYKLSLQQQWLWQE